MRVKVAVASSDGKVVNSHFGRASQFLIFELGKLDCHLIEVRANQPGCSNLLAPTGTMEDTIKTIEDCDYVLVSQIGKPMCNRLLVDGIKAYAKPNMIESGLAELRDMVFGNH